MKTLLPLGALLALSVVACTDTVGTDTSDPALKVARGQAESGTYTCKSSVPGNPTYKHVTADEKNAIIKSGEGYTCTRD